MSLAFLCIALEMESLVQRVKYVNRGLEMTRFLEGKGLELKLWSRCCEYLYMTMMARNIYKIPRDCANGNKDVLVWA